MSPCFELLSLVQLLGAPFWALALVLSALLAPTRGTHRILFVAFAVEPVIGVCALVHWRSATMG